MKVSTFKHCLFEGMKNLKRNITTTITSSIAAEISISLIGIFFLYFATIESSLLTFFKANERYCIDISRIGKVIKIIVCVVLPLVSVSIVTNVIKISVFCRREEILTMKLVGATKWLIAWPFIIEGLVIGLIGGFLSTFFVYFIYKIICLQVVEFIPTLQTVSLIFIVKKLFTLLVIYGVLSGVAGSVISLKKNL